MSNDELLRLVGKYQIEAFKQEALGHPLDREKAINSLVARDAARQSNAALVISIFSFLGSIAAIIISLLRR